MDYTCRKSDTLSAQTAVQSNGTSAASYNEYRGSGSELSKLR